MVDAVDKWVIRTSLGSHEEPDLKQSPPNYNEPLFSQIRDLRQGEIL